MRWMLYLRGVEIPVMTIIAFIIAFMWAIGMVIAPLTLPPGSVEDLTGIVGRMDNTNVTKDMNPYAKFYYEAGDSQCHQIKERSLFINGNQMPFCSRDVAIFFGLALGLAITLFIRFELRWWWIIGGLVPIGIDGTLQLLTSYESNTFLRLSTGLVAGVVTTLALGCVFWDSSRALVIIKEEQLEGDMEGYLEEEMRENLGEGMQGHMDDGFKGGSEDEMEERVKGSGERGPEKDFEDDLEGKID